MNKKMDIYLTATKIGDDCGLTASKVNKIFEKIGWLEKLENGWSITESAKTLDALKKIHASNKKTFVMWHRSILNNILFIKEVEKSKILSETYKANVKKGEEFEIYVGKHFERFGCSVEYRGIEQGKKDAGIDLVVSMNDTYIFIQCKNWNSKKIKKKDIAEFYGDYNTFLENNPEMKEKKTKACYYVSGEIYDKGALLRAEESENLELHVLPFEDVRKSA